MTADEPLLEFLAVMRRLRAECPWKREQTHRSLARYLLEETHETLEAIDTGDETGDWEHLREELGDLLLQVYFHAVIAEESGAFTIDDVARGITEKMYRRNPHVFGPPSDDPPADAADTLQWGLAPTGGTLDPAVTAWIAEQLGRRAAARGDQTAALAQYRAAAAAWQQSGDHRGQLTALTQGALLAARLHDPDARALLEEALQASTASGAADKPRLQCELAKLLWPAQRDRARALARAALADLPDSSRDASDLRQWLKRRDAER